MSGQRRSKVVFIALGICLVAIAAALNVGFVIKFWRTGLLLISGILFFAAIIAGVALNTIFLVREIRRNEQHDAFINSVTHELKTPIASIHLYLETLQKRPVAEPRRQEFYKIMLEDCERLSGTIEQVLRASQTARRRGRIEKERLDLRELVAQCVELARTRHHLDEGALEFRSPVARAEVLGAPDELRVAVTNLLDNAIKYSGKEVRVDVTCEKPDPRKVVVRVRDRGVGIPPQELKRIFGRFYRIPGGIARRVTGTGLGLFIVWSVASRHGGRVFAESDGLGAGSRFTIELPAAPSL